MRDMSMIVTNAIQPMIIQFFIGVVDSLALKPSQAPIGSVRQHCKKASFDFGLTKEHFVKFVRH